MVEVYQVVKVEEYECDEVMGCFTTQEDADHALELVIKWNEKIAKRTMQSVNESLGKTGYMVSNWEVYRSTFIIRPAIIFENVEQFVTHFNKDTYEEEKMDA